MESNYLAINLLSNYINLKTCFLLNTLLVSNIYYQLLLSLLVVFIIFKLNYNLKLFTKIK